MLLDDESQTEKSNVHIFDQTDREPRGSKLAGNVTTSNLLQDIQHNPRTNKSPMPDVLSGGTPRQTPPK